MDTEMRFAILIDADNISDKYIKIVIDEMANYGIATYRRIYGDWTSPRLASWKSILLEYSITPMQQYSYTTGKNSTDSAMIIDAMDILYSDTVDGFCIVSSDSDFTRLAARLRESGMQVIGMGEEKTPQPFIAACNQFKYLDLLYANQKQAEEELLMQAEAARAGAANAERAQEKRGSNAGTGRSLKRIRKVIRDIVETFSDEDGWVSSGALGDQLSKRMPDFDVRNYGYQKLTPFIDFLDEYEIKKQSMGNGLRQYYFRKR